MTAKNRPCWIIIVDQTPTSFRSRKRETLLPTLKQLQRTQPGTILMWYDRGRFWRSEEEARQALLALRKARGQRPTDRDRDWRPGGIHKDPRARPQLTRDERRARFKKRLIETSREESGSSRAEDRKAGPRRDATRPRQESDSRERSRPGGYQGAKPGGYKGSKPDGSRGAKPGGYKGSKPDGSRGAKPGGYKGSKPGGSRSAKPGGYKGSKPGSPRGANPKGPRKPKNGGYKKK